jgi:hypothetical protein
MTSEFLVEFGRIAPFFSQEHKPWTLVGFHSPNLGLRLSR